MKKLKPWIESFRLSITIPAGLLIHAGARLAHKPTDWLLVIETFFIASLAMLSNDYYDRFNDCKKGKLFAYQNSKEVKIVVIVGWFIVWVIALVFLLEYWVILLPIVVISMFYSWTHKIMYLQTFFVALTSASTLLVGHLGTVSISELDSNFIFFSIVFIAIYAREMAKDIADAKTDKEWKHTPISKGKISLDQYLDIAGSLIYICALILTAWLVHHSSSISISSQVCMVAGLIFCLSVCVHWKHSGFLSVIPNYYIEREDQEVFSSLMDGKAMFNLSMISIITGIILM